MNWWESKYEFALNTNASEFILVEFEKSVWIIPVKENTFAWFSPEALGNGPMTSGVTSHLADSLPLTYEVPALSTSTDSGKQ